MTERYFLTKIAVEGFRGINNEGQPLVLNFKPAAVNSVFASNGVGKSSVFEALTYAIRGAVPRLTELQAQENPLRYEANLFHSQRSATIDIGLEDSEGKEHLIRVTRSSSGKRTVSSLTQTSDPEAILKSLDSDFVLLDYAQFNRFMADTPLDRGRSFSALLGLSALSNTRQYIGALANNGNLNSDLSITTQQAEVSVNERQASALLLSISRDYLSLRGEELLDTSDLDGVGRNVVEALKGIQLFAHAIDATELKEVDFSLLHGLIQDAESGEDRKALADAIRKISDLDTIVPFSEQDASTIEAKLNEAGKEREVLLTATRGDLYRHLHEAGDTFLRSQGSSGLEETQCPLCSREGIHPVLDQIEAELQKYQQLAHHDSEVAKWLSQTAWPAFLEGAHTVLGDLTAEDGSSTDNSMSSAATLASVRRMSKGEPFEHESVVSSLTYTRRVVAAIASRRSKAQSTKASVENRLPPSLVALTQRVELASALARNLALLDELTSSVKELKARVADALRWKAFIQRANTLFGHAEADLTNRRLKELDDSYKQLFRSIIGVQDIVPSMQRAQADQKLDVRLESFHGLSNESARALLSESYRNAFAISVFLSAASTSKFAARFIVLDDVTSSFDAGNQWMLMEQLRTTLRYSDGNASGLQFILLSHDGLMEKYFDKCDDGPAWHHQRLQGLSPLGQVTTVAQSASRLKDSAMSFLTAGQVPQAQPLIRQYLEFVLLQIIRKVQIPVPYDFAIRDQQKMVQNCLDAIASALLLHEAAGKLVLEPQQIQRFREQILPQLVSNYLSHYATAASASVSPHVLIGVLELIDSIPEQFQYSDESGAMRWYRALDRQ